jgi:hypothetical protein
VFLLALGANVERWDGHETRLAFLRLHTRLEGLT